MFRTPWVKTPYVLDLGLFVCSPRNPHPRPTPPGELTEFNPMAAFRAVQGPSTKGAKSGVESMHPMGPPSPVIAGLITL